MHTEKKVEGEDEESPPLNSVLAHAAAASSRIAQKPIGRPPLPRHALAEAPGCPADTVSMATAEFLIPGAVEDRARNCSVAADSRFVEEHGIISRMPRVLDNCEGEYGQQMISGLEGVPSWHGSLIPRASSRSPRFSSGDFRSGQVSNSHRIDTLARLWLARVGMPQPFDFSVPHQTVDQCGYFSFPSTPEGAHPMSSQNIQWHPLRGAQTFGCEDSLITEGKVPRFANGESRSSPKLQRNQFSPEQASSSYLPQNRDNLMAANERTYTTAYDWRQCQASQSRIAGPSADVVDDTYHWIIDYVSELMVCPTRSGLLQKLLEVCNEGQRLEILVRLTKEPLQFVKKSVHRHGTKVAQKLIETLKTEQQIALLITALKPRFLDLAKNTNGCCVIECCLKSLAPHYCGFIFHGAAQHFDCLVAHRKGFCVLYDCLEKSSGDQRARLLIEITRQSYLLAFHPYGNFLVQEILRLRDPIINGNLALRFRGHYASLSKNKFSAHVVENCLEYFGPEEKANIVHELLSVSKFEELIKDQFANYVILCALDHAEGALRAKLDQAILHHVSLRSYPYCKKIFSKVLGRR